MIPVVSPIPEPAAFDADCRQKGLEWLASHPNPEGRPRDFWSNFRDDLREGFARRCGYFAMYMHDGTVDHYISWDSCKTNRPHLAYEWDNYRFIAPSLNSSKRTQDDQLLDPFEIQQGWFVVEIPSFVLRMTNLIPDGDRARAAFTLDRLDLEQGRRAVALRWEWYEQHRCGNLNLAGLRYCAPLVATAVENWQLAGNGNLPVIPRPIH